MILRLLKSNKVQILLIKDLKSRQRISNGLPSVLVYINCIYNVVQNSDEF